MYGANYTEPYCGEVIDRRYSLGAPSLNWNEEVES